MSFKAIINELFGLFVDDGSLAVNLLVWTVCAGATLVLLADGGVWQAPLMTAGYLAILIENVLRSARESKSS